MGGFERPWIQRTHPPLFNSLVFTAIAHIGIGVTAIVAPHQFLVPGYQYLNDWARPEAWGWLSVAAAVLILVGLFHRTTVAYRAGISAGLVLCAAFVLSLFLAWTHHVLVGVGVFVWLAWTATHVSILAIYPYERRA